MLRGQENKQGSVTLILFFFIFMNSFYNEYFVPPADKTMGRKLILISCNYGSFINFAINNTWKGIHTKKYILTSEAYYKHSQSHLITSSDARKEEEFVVDAIGV